MAKIPAGAIIAQAYGFTVREFPRILGVMWLPWAIMALGGALLTSRAMALSTALATHDAAALARVLPVLVPFYLLVLLLLFMQIAGIAELALGLKTGSPFYYFSLGRPVWRLCGAFLLMLLAIALGWTVLLLLVMLAGVAIRAAEALHLLAATPGLDMAIALVLILWCAFAYAVLRLAFFLTPVTIAEGRITPLRSWRLGLGNVGRIIAVLFAVLLPVVIIELVFVLGFLTHGLPPLPPPHATPQQAEIARLGMAAWNAVAMARASHYWYVSYPAFLLIAVLLYGLGVGAQCFAYRAVTAEEASASRP